VIAWENASSKFNRALQVPSQGLWKRQDKRTRMNPDEEDHRANR